MLQVLGLVGLGGLAQDLGDLALELVKGVAGGGGGVGGHLGPVQRDHTQSDQACRRTQPKRLDKEPGQRLLVADPEPGDGRVVGCLVAGKHPEGKVLGAAPLDLPGGPHPDRVAGQQHAQHGLGVIGGMAVPVGPIGTQERTEVELVDHVQHEPGQMVLGEPVAQVGGQQERLVAVAAKEVVGHDVSYLFATLVPNVLASYVSTPEPCAATATVSVTACYVSTHPTVSPERRPTDQHAPPART